MFSANPKASLIYEADFVEGAITKTGVSKVGDTAKYFPFPQIAGKSPIVLGGDTAVAFKDDAATTALMEYLASPDAAAIWAKAGGYLSLNKKLDNSVYPNTTRQQLAKDLIAAGDDLRFDMSDLAPPAFDGEGKALWKQMQEFLKNPANAPAIQQALETAAAAAYKK